MILGLEAVSRVLSLINGAAEVNFRVSLHKELGEDMDGAYKCATSLRAPFHDFLALRFVGLVSLHPHEPMRWSNSGHGLTSHFSLELVYTGRRPVSKAN